MRFLILFIIVFFFFSCSDKKFLRTANTRYAGYAIQVGAFRNLENAEKLIRSLENQGLDCFYFRRNDGFFVVRFGDFRDYQTAKDYAKKLKEKGVIDDFFVAEPYNARELVNLKRTGKPPKEKDLGYIIAETAKRFVGIPYKWGGDNVVEGMDCSGFTKAIYNLCGINIPRTADAQMRDGYPVDFDELKEGDLVFFGSNGKATHVGIYIGDGKMVHAPKRNDEIKISDIYSGYFKNRYIGGRRYY